jgi:hypothetical protein
MPFILAQSVSSSAAVSANGEKVWDELWDDGLGHSDYFRIG